MNFKYYQEKGISTVTAIKGDLPKGVKAKTAVDYFNSYIKFWGKKKGKVVSLALAEAAIGLTLDKGNYEELGLKESDIKKIKV